VVDDAVTIKPSNHRSRISIRGLGWLVLILALAGVGTTSGSETLHAGPLFDHFQLTLEPGERTEMAGPFFYSEQKESERVWAVPPLMSYARDPVKETMEFDFAYPLLTYNRYGEQYRWQFFQLWSFAGGPSQLETNRDRFTLFPIYFSQRSPLPEENYTAVLPFYGHLKSRLFRDEVFFVMLPIYVQSRKRDVYTDNYVYPFFHLRHGDGLRGWQFWPLAGHERKGITTRTNSFNDIEAIGGHEESFVLWPFFATQEADIGTTNQFWQQQILPFYSLVRSAQRDQTTILWPFFSYIDEREKNYREWEAPWPFIVIARGEGKTITRFWPLFSRAHNATLETHSFLWPIYKHDEIHSAPLDRRRNRVVFFVYNDVTTKNTETGAFQRRTDLWPLYAYRRDLKGNTRVQVLALIESYLPGSHKIERDYSPFWTVWRSERKAANGATSQSLLWNLYRQEKAPDSSSCSFFFGLFQSKSDATGRQTRWFYLPPIKSHRAEAPEAPKPP